MQISNHLAELSQSTDMHLIKYDRLLFLGDFNAGVEDSSVKNFLFYNDGHNILRIFGTLPVFLFTTSEKKRDYS